MSLIAIVSVALLSAINFVVNLGTSSLFIDEVYSWRAASVSLSQLYSRVRFDEVAPPTYYVGLHEWILRLGREAEWSMRLPSALAGVALVLVAYWLARRIAGPRAALLASLLTALSPLVLEYAQMARGYIFAMLFSAVAVAAALEHDRRAERRSRWLALSALAAALALATHYIANLVVLPLAAWLLLRGRLDRHSKAAYAATLVAIDAVLAPLALHQLGRGHQKGVAPAAHLTVGHALQVVGGPFDGRISRVTGWVVVGALVAVVAIVFAARDGERRLVRELLLPLSVVAPAVLVVVSLVSSPSMLSRYVTVSAPFLIVLISCVATWAPVLVRWTVVLAAVAAAIGGSALSHSRSGFFPDTRGAMSYIGRDWQTQDALLVAGYPAIGSTLEYYLDRLPSGPTVVFPGDRIGLQRVAEARRRLWVLTSLPVGSAGQIQAFFSAFGYRPMHERRFPASTSLTVLLASPQDLLAATTFQDRVSAICSQQHRALAGIASPTNVAQLVAALRKELPAMRRALHQIGRVPAPASLTRLRARAIRLSDQEIAALELIEHAGRDAEQRLTASRARITHIASEKNAAWQTLGVPSCAA